MKFLYIVDHPSRDLPSYAWWTTSSGFHSKTDTIALISMNDISPAVLNRSLFDIIIWNYARPNNISLIRIASRMGIYNIIHDTEGIPYATSSYYSNLKRSDFLFINEIWTWGEIQLEHLQKRFKKEGISTIVRTTGSIRYAYANQLPKIDISTNRNALWNTNFPFISPKYMSFEKEFTDLCQIQRYPLADSLDIVRTSAECRIYAIYKCIEIASALPDLNIVLRTHPFEAKDFYIANMADVNLSFSTDQDVNDDICFSSFILHSGCQTSLDAFFRGVPSFVFSYSNANIWASISCMLPSDLSKLMDVDFLYSSLRAQRKLFTDFDIDGYLANLSDKYNHLIYFDLNHIVLPCSRYRSYWNLYYNIRRFIARILHLLAWHSKRNSSQTRHLSSKKLSASAIALYVEDNFKVATSTRLNCVYISFA